MSKEAEKYICPNGCGRNGDLGSCEECLGKNAIQYYDEQYLEKYSIDHCNQQTKDLRGVNIKLTFANNHIRNESIPKKDKAIQELRQENERLRELLVNTRDELLGIHGSQAKFVNCYNRIEQALTKKEDRHD